RRDAVAAARRTGAGRDGTAGGIGAHRVSHLAGFRRPHQYPPFAHRGWRLPADNAQAPRHVGRHRRTDRVGELTMSLTDILNFVNMLTSSVLVILTFSLLSYTLTYNFRTSVARRFALLLAFVMLVYAADVALGRVLSAESANRWLRLQWLGITMVPAAAYHFSLAVPEPTNDRVHRRRWIGYALYVLSRSEER